MEPEARRQGDLKQVSSYRHFMLIPAACNRLSFCTYTSSARKVCRVALVPYPPEKVSASGVQELIQDVTNET